MKRSSFCVIVETMQSGFRFVATCPGVTCTSCTFRIKADGVKDFGEVMAGLPSEDKQRIKRAYAIAALRGKHEGLI